jgi:hypothetical protein
MIASTAAPLPLKTYGIGQLNPFLGSSRRGDPACSIRPLAECIPVIRCLPILVEACPPRRVATMAVIPGGLVRE